MSDRPAAPTVSIWSAGGAAPADALLNDLVEHLRAGGAICTVVRVPAGAGGGAPIWPEPVTGERAFTIVVLTADLSVPPYEFEGLIPVVLEANSLKFLPEELADGAYDVSRPQDLERLVWRLWGGAQAPPPTDPPRNGGREDQPVPPPPPAPAPIAPAYSAGGGLAGLARALGASAAGLSGAVSALVGGLTRAAAAFAVEPPGATGAFAAEPSPAADAAPEPPPVARGFAAEPPEDEPWAASSPEKTAYARIEIAADVRVGEEQPLVAGIAAARQANVAGEPMSIGSDYPFDLTITVIAQEFVLRAGERWSNTIQVTADAPYPAIALHVTASAASDLTAPQRRTIAVLYSVDAHTIGYGAVEIGVHPAEASLHGGAQTSAEGAVTAFPHEAAFDLTVRINAFGDGNGRLQWSFESPHLKISGEPVETTAGSEPSAFAAGLIRDVNAASAGMVGKVIAGNSKIVARAMPDEFFSIWGQLHAAMPEKRPPTVLILSEDAYIPWELAEVAPLFDADAPALFGAQAEIGRWILSSRNELPIPPPLDLELRPMVEVTAKYVGAKTPRLVHAEEEGAELQRVYGAQHVDATGVAITGCFHDANPPATTMHVALHGIYDAMSPVDGLIMADSSVLNASAIEGGTALKRAFVFLNACQVGVGKETLGHYAGIPAAFVYAKARGVIAPLWSIDDAVAKEIALRFYAGLAQGESPAALLRAERKRFNDAATRSSTLVAYVFFGNPRSKTNGEPVTPATTGG